MLLLGQHFLFTCSGTSAVGCTYRSATVHSVTDRRTDGQTDDIMMTIVDHTVRSPLYATGTLRLKQTNE